MRLTPALTYVLPEDSLPPVVARLATRLKQQTGLHATVPYLDKGFCCSGEVIRYLQRTQQTPGYKSPSPLLKIDS